MQYAAPILAKMREKVKICENKLCWIVPDMVYYESNIKMEKCFASWGGKAPSQKQLQQGLLERPMENENEVREWQYGKSDEARGAHP